jgi:hypothetical protein
MRIKNQVVVATSDDRRIKGFTWDFAPNREKFHVADPQDEHKVVELSIADLKAIFFVKTFEGIPTHQSPAFTEESLEGVIGLKIKVTFTDGEVMFGTTNGYQPGRTGFFVMPADKACNNERVYVVSAATQSVDTWRNAPVAVR